MADQSDMWVFRGERGDDLCGAIAAAVVDDDDLEGVDDMREDLEGAADDGADVLLLIVGRQHEGERSGNAPDGGVEGGVMVHAPSLIPRDRAAPTGR